MNVRKTSAAFAAVATAGASSFFLGATPAMAAPGEPCLDGVLVEPGICELSYTDGVENVFTPTAEMTQLEVLLVGAGGSGADQPEVNTAGYAAAGGGGQVTYIDFSGSTDEIDIAVAAAGGSISTADNGSIADSAANGSDALTTEGSNIGGNSGDNEYEGYSGTLAGGGGAGGDADVANGGDGVIVSSLVAPGSLFENDDRCFGGGGAAGSATAQGFPGCGGGGPIDALGTGLVAAVPNSGGGGGGLTTTQSAELRAGADGVVLVRWNAAPVTLTFDVRGKGVAPAAQEVIPGFAPTAPVAPKAAGFEFKGWFADAALTVPVDFSTPLTESTTYYASWAPTLAATGSTTDAASLPIALGILAAGAGLVVAATARKRRQS
ncbi:putative repeat protein (TIGR02543 family) [Microbacteriaceae bacterium SG_E_30_P1]|uniref:Repeat protein (TIGR02543 family) n=1 Tax=Antiquaquibacter oligotrophicus TaxID=2880260 RepID=A0ABT6KRG5_9MICO|nr:InlB B-repeat-containing protein [Antiquaquibacter oligotrophicus]MDH6182572.1 putative repeat protein (TIGR02543 family) [Antiquaquibacter oligotrophicus]UDF14461.1 InlB B-repeat-containing protein [Antiquaquibacter oligotrophicus]